MEVTFILPYVYSTTPFKIPCTVYCPGVASLSAYLKKYGHSINLVQYVYPPNKRELISQISKVSPDIIAFSSNSHMFHYVREWSRWIKERFDIPIICGGIHPTIDPENTIMEEGIDIICRGEGEEALLELCTRYERGEDITNILNLWVKRDGKIYKNPLRPLIEDLDSLPFPDREIFKDKSYKIIQVMVTRGCPYDCSFCCVPKVREIYQGKFKKFIRFRSVEKTIQYLKKIITDYPSAKYIRFIDDILNLDKSWFRAFAIMYKKEIDFPYQCYSHVSLIDKETARLFRYSGCKRIYFGIESGNDYIRKRIYNKSVEKEQIVRAFRLCQDEGIQTYAFNMIGAPFEDMEAVLDTVKLNAEVSVSNGIGSSDLPSIFYPYFGTKLYKLCADNKLMTNREFDSFAQGVILSQPSIKRKQILFVLFSFVYFVRLYSLCNRFPKAMRKFYSRLLDRLFLYKRLPYSIIVFILQGLHNIIFGLYLVEIWVRNKFPKTNLFFNVFINR